MSMMNCNEHGKELKMSDHMLHARKLRPLMPRPTASTKTTTCSPMPAPHICCIPNSSICAWNYHLTTSSVYQSKREINAEPLVSPRWNPTPEQIQALEEMYGRGLRTPTAEQIQQIAAKLRQFGKIEGKNVFYWFQNHKARERQKWRRQLGSLPGKKLRYVKALEKNESDLSKKDDEVEQAKNWATLSNCSTMSEDSASKHRAVMAESRTTGWAQFDERDQLQQTSKRKRVMKATLQADLSSHLPHNYYYLLNTMNTTTKFDDDTIMENEDRENQVLQLFPPGSNNQSAIRTIEKENEVFTTNINTTPIQFFEFLPLKT